MNPLNQLSLEEFRNFFFYYMDKPHQRDAVEALWKAMPVMLLEETAEWVETYRTPADQLKDEAVVSNPLSVPYDCQLDNPSGEGWRECFSSSCAMAAMYWGVIDNPNEYHAIRPQYGDSTDPSAQIRTLQSLGLDARFVQVGSVEMLKAQIDRGRPVPVGFLHHGTPSAPSGGGHYICAIGYTDTHLIAHDPYGELDVANGGYPLTGGTYGKEIQYSWKNWAPRWSVANNNDGWGLDISLPGKSEGGNTETPTNINEAGLALIKEFEGLRLEAYLCPAGVETIGYGHTGDDVWLGKVISEPEAESLLRQDLWSSEDTVSSAVHVTLTDNEYAALVSWCFNIGCGAAKSSTLVRRLNAYEDKERVIREELPRWNKGGGGVLPGLVRRREAEIALAVS